MTITDAVVDAAFEQHGWRYAKRERAWDVPHHVGLWTTAEQAFARPCAQSFGTVHDELRTKWKAFRGGMHQMSVTATFDLLCGVNQAYRRKRMSELTDRDILPLWEFLNSVSKIKENKSGPSIVAISKLLHFWNPRLFMIVDDGVVWNRVFDRWWLWDDLLRVRESTDAKLQNAADTHEDSVCDLSSYLAILFWGAALLNDNPNVLKGYRKYLDKWAGQCDIQHAGDYEAAAIEWFLLGAIELPPHGINLQRPAVGPLV